MKFDKLVRFGFVRWIIMNFVDHDPRENIKRDAVAKVIAELPQKDPKMAGRVIGAIKKQFGDRADAQLTKKIAEELLSK